VSETGPIAEPPAAGESETGRAAHVISQYYYVVAAIGVALVLGGVVAALFGIRTLVLPHEFEAPRDALRTVFHGLAFALPGAALLWWHLREARRREGLAAPASFWGRSLYFHLVAFVAMWFAVGGVILALSAAAEAAVPNCVYVAKPVPEGTEAPEVTPTQQCYPDPAGAARQALDGAIFVLAAGPVWWWHLRQKEGHSADFSRLTATRKPRIS
jgi:hypothetical protein